MFCYACTRNNTIRIYLQGLEMKCIPKNQSYSGSHLLTYSKLPSVIEPMAVSIGGGAGEWDSVIHKIIQSDSML